MFASIRGRLCVCVGVCVPGQGSGHVAVAVVRRHSVSIANGDRIKAALKLPHSLQAPGETIPHRTLIIIIC